MGKSTTTEPTPTDDSVAGEGAATQTDSLTLEQQEAEALEMILSMEDGDGYPPETKSDRGSEDDASGKRHGPERSEAPSDTDEPEDSDSSEDGQDEGTPEEGQDDEDSDEGSGEDSTGLAPEVEANYKKRVASAQQKMHEATQELAAERKAREALEARLSELESKVDSGPAPDLLEDFTKGLDDNTAALLEDTPELKTAFGHLLNRLSKLEGNVDQRVQEVLQRRDQADAERTVAQKERDWRLAVMEEQPDLFEIAESPEWQEWVSTHQETYKTIVGKYDQFDPRNALELYDAFARDTRKTSSATRRSDEAASAALGLKKTNGRRGSSKSSQRAPQSYKQMEMEALDQILAEEKAAQAY